MHTKKTNNTNKLMQISYHSALTKIKKLQNLKKKKKNFFFVLARTLGTDRYCLKLAGMPGILSGTKQGGYTYWFTCRYGIFRPYRLVRYRIDSLGHSTFIKKIRIRVLCYFCEWFSRYTYIYLIKNGFKKYQLSIVTLPK